MALPPQWGQRLPIDSDLVTMLQVAQRERGRYENAKLADLETTESAEAVSEQD